MATKWKDRPLEQRQRYGRSRKITPEQAERKRVKSRERYKNFTPEQLVEHRRQCRYNHLQLKYGISEEQYNTMYECQGGRCAICLEVHEVLHVDHSHATDKVRGLLCHTCNVAAGKVRDSITIARRLSDYLLLAGETDNYCSPEYQAPVVVTGTPDWCRPL